MTGQRKRTWAQIDLTAAEHNFRQVRAAVAPGTMVCCTIKANAYGHGAVQMARLYEELGADFFAVSNIEEALQLRRHGIETIKQDVDTSQSMRSVRHKAFMKSAVSRSWSLLKKTMKPY